MSPQEMKAVVERVAMELWNKRNYSVIDEVYAVDVKANMLPPEQQGRAGIRQFAEHWHHAMPDFELNIVDIVVENSKVMVQWSDKGTWEKPAGIFPALGRIFEWQGVSILRFADGKVVEEWLYSNLLDQMGAVELVVNAHQKTAT